jgi:hypothetical protein
VIYTGDRSGVFGFRIPIHSSSFCVLEMYRHCVRLSPQQLGQLLSALRALLAAPTALSLFIALRMLVAGLEASAQLLGPNARRHGVDLVLQEIIGKAAGGDGSGSADGGGDDDGGVDEAATAALAVHSSRAQTISLKPEDVVTLATRASSLLRAVPVSASESSVKQKRRRDREQM